MTSQRLLVVGNGMAGLRFVEELTRLAPGRFAITVVGAEDAPAYNRVLLSPLLSGEIAAGDLQLKARAWYAEHDISLLTGSAVAMLEPERGQARLADGRRLSFDICVLATGSEPIRLPVPGGDLEGVTTFRTLADADALAAFAGSGSPGSATTGSRGSATTCSPGSAGTGARAVVIGGGLLGIEAAYGLARAGARVSLVHLMDRLMERQLDAEGAGLLRRALEAKGIEVLLGAETARIAGAGHVERLELKDGRVVPCGLVVMAVGVRPEVALARASGIVVKRGIVVDDRLATSHDNVFAIGECAEHRGAVYGLVEPAYEQARVLAAALCGEPAVSYGGSVLATNLKVSGVPVFSAGDFEGVGAETIVMRDGAAGGYRKLVVRDGCLAGAVLVGDTADALWYLELIRSGAEISNMRRVLAFGRAYAEAA